MRGSRGSCAARTARALECATAIPISILVAVSISISLSFCGCQSVFGCCANICLVLRHLPYLQFNLMQMQTDKWETSIKYAHNSLDNYRINKTDYFLTHQDTKGREAAATSQTMPGYASLSQFLCQDNDMERGRKRRVQLERMKSTSEGLSERGPDIKDLKEKNQRICNLNFEFEF